MVKNSRQGSQERRAIWRSATTVGLLFGLAVAAGPLTAADTDRPIIVNRDFGIELPEMYVPDEFIVVFKKEVRPTLAVGRNAFGTPTINVPSLEGAISRFGVKSLARQFPMVQEPARGTPFTDLTGHYKVRINGGVDLERAMAAFERDPSVEHVEKIGVHFIHVDANDPFYKDSPDPNFNFDQWHYFDRGSENFSIQANEAWDVESGSPDVVVAVADSGVRYFHIDLGGNNAQWGPNDPKTNGNIFVNTAEIPGTGVDNDGNGFIDDTIGWDFVASTAASGCSCLDADCGTADNDPDDFDGHGTHVAGTVAAITNNARQVAGVAGGFSDGTTTGAGNGVKILPLRIGWHARCFGVTGGVVRMDYAAESMNYVSMMKDRGVNIAAYNASWGSSNSGGISAAVDNMLARDVMLIAAAGNSNSSTAPFLSTKAGVMSVAATTRTGTGASFTNHGSWVSLAAPGLDILSTYRNPADSNPGAHYIAVLSGTSMSAPHACGVAALLESCNTSLTRAQKFSLMVNNVRAYSDNRNLGSGILNAKLALAAAGCTGAPGCTTNADCNDGNACTTDVCNNGVCSSTPINCDDGNACTVDSCSGGTCFNDPINCDDGNPCTADSCNTSTGCVNTPIAGCCGNGVCESGETQCNCPQDCGNPPDTETNCSDGIDNDCDGLIDGDDPDCQGGGAVCGNNICEISAGENCLNCPSDCNGVQSGRPQNRYCCGDGAGTNPVDCSDPRCTGGGNTCEP